MYRIIYVLLVSVVFQSCAVSLETDLRYMQTENQKLADRISELELMLQDTDKDGVPDYLDREKNSEPDALVNIKGITIDVNKNGIADEWERYNDGNNGNNGSTISANQQPTLIYCCENHNPSHCGKNFNELSKFATQQKCIFR